MLSIGSARIFTIIWSDNPNLQKMKPPTRLSSKKLIGSPVQILERLGRERTGKGQGVIYYLNLGFIVLNALSKTAFFSLVTLAYPKHIVFCFISFQYKPTTFAPSKVIVSFPKNARNLLA